MASLTQRWILPSVVAAYFGVVMGPVVLLGVMVGVGALVETIILLICLPLYLLSNNVHFVSFVVSGHLHLLVCLRIIVYLKVLLMRLLVHKHDRRRTLLLHLLRVVLWVRLVVSHLGLVWMLNWSLLEFSLFHKLILIFDRV